LASSGFRGGPGARPQEASGFQRIPKRGAGQDRRAGAGLAANTFGEALSVTALEEKNPRERRTAVVVDFENVYWADRRTFSDEREVEKLARALSEVAEHCGPLTMRKVYAPFDRFPRVMAVFTDAGYDCVTCGTKENAADLKLIADLAGLTASQDVGLVFLVSGDGDMLDAIEHAQKQGARVVVISCSRRELAATTRAAADKVLLLPEIYAEARRIRKGNPTKLNLKDLVPHTPHGETLDEALSAAGGEEGGRVAGGLARRDAGARPRPGRVSGAGPEPGPELSTGEQITISPTALKAYVQCPRRYYFSYVERREEKPSRPLFIGSVVHQALKEFFTSEPRERTWPALERALREAWARSPERREVFASRSEEAEAGREVLADLKQFFKQADRKVVPFGLEVFLRTRVGDGVHVRGRVDRIDEDPRTGRLTVIDYKTGRVPAQRPNLVDDFQLPLYQAMVDEAYSREVDRVVLHYLKGNVTFEFSLEADDVRRAKDRAFAIARRAARDRDYAPRVSALCRSCSFLEDCPARAEAESRFTRPAPDSDAGLPDLPF